MKEIRFEDAFAPEPAMVHACVERTLREVTTMTKRTHVVRAAAFALLLMMLLGSAAYAAVTGGVLDYVFGGGQSVPTERQMALVQPIHVSGTVGEVTITVTEAMFDGRKLDVGLCIDRRAYVLPVSITVDGEEASIQAVDEGFLLDSLTGGFTALTERHIQGTVEAAVRLIAYDSDPYDERPANTLGELTLTFPIRADDASQPLRLGEYAFAAEVALLEGYSGSMQTRLVLGISPVDDGLTSQQLESIFRWITCYDENKQPAPFQETWYYGGSGLVETGEGFAYLVEYTLPALKTLPQTLWLVPCSHEYPDGQWAYAIPLHPAD